MVHLQAKLDPGALPDLSPGLSLSLLPTLTLSLVLRVGFIHRRHIVARWLLGILCYVQIIVSGGDRASSLA